MTILNIAGSTEFDFNADTFDSRDAIYRIAYLEQTAPIDREPDEQDELDDLYALQDEADDGTTDWKYGTTFINDDHFEDFAEQLADDLGLIQRKAGWPNAYIDWERAARDLQMDYTSFELRGTTYWAR